MVLEKKWPVLGRHERAAGWLQVWADLGRAPRTIDAYARGLAEYLEMCERENVDPLTANRAHIAFYVRELTSRPSRRGANVVSIDSGSGLANATIQQRLVPVRLFYDFLMEDGQRDSNPVGRGRYTPGRRRGGHERGLVPRLTKLPWIPTEQQWMDVGAQVHGPARTGCCASFPDSWRLWTGDAVHSPEGLLRQALRPGSAWNVAENAV
ncbi:site-specific integrase [Streptomyces sp. NPDC001832]|uniref:site-specific integrase n=1 Tax=Streptomyces sp. NPDC001832 TaxID=3154527 RepID=UPI003334664F